MTDKKNLSTATIVSALRCMSATAGNCIGEACPFWQTEDVPDELRARVGADVWGSCDCDAVGMAAAERLEEQSVLCSQPIRQPDTLNQYRDRIYADAVAHGLWEHGGGQHAYLAGAKLILGEALELLEEAYRLDVYLRAEGLSNAEGSYRWHAFMMELADVMISCLSCCGEMGINADMIVGEKMNINHKRSWKHEND